MHARLEQFLALLRYRGQVVKLASYQRTIIEKSINPSKSHLLVLASTRAGKTFTCAIIALVHALLLHRNVLIISPTFSQSQIMMRTIWDFIHESNLHSLVNEEREARQDLITFHDNTRIKMLSAHSPESLLGFGADTVIIDEASIIDDEVYEQYILRMLMNNPKALLIAISTTQRRNFLYTLTKDEKKAEVIRITVEDAIREGIMAEKMVEEARNTLTESMFRAWYYAEFLDVNESERLFERAVVEECMNQSVDMTLFANGRIGIGIDVARFNDYTCVVVLRVVGDCVNVENTFVLVDDVLFLREVSTQKQAELIDKFLSKYDTEFMLIDATGVGVGVYDLLSAKGLPLKRLEFSSLAKKKDESAIFLANLMKIKHVFFNKGVIERHKSLILEQIGYHTVENGQVKKTNRTDVHDDFADALIYAFLACLSTISSFRRIDVRT